MSPISIRPATAADADDVWRIFKPIIAAGDTFPELPDSPRELALQTWFGAGIRSYVAEYDGQVVGAYYLKPNRLGLGAHVANGGYIVDPQRHGQGIGSELGRHSIDEARRLGYRALQFNLVVETNAASIALWRKLGFTVVGRLPGAFRHIERGYVDALVVYRSLLPE
jgi:L-amino acid N-acyltransferase YncA